MKIVSAGEHLSTVEVDAHKGGLSWDKDYAKEVLARIVQGRA